MRRDVTTTVAAADIRSAVGLASANLDTQLSGIQSDTDNIQTRIPAALVSGRIDASVGAMASGTVTNTAIADGAITDAKITMPAETTGYVTGFLAKMAQLYNRFFSKVDYDKSGLTIKTYQSDGTTQQTSQTVVTNATNDTVGKAS